MLLGLKEITLWLNWFGGKGKAAWVSSLLTGVIWKNGIEIEGCNNEDISCFLK